MIGPFKPAPGNFKFVFVLIDKFSKWIEYMPLVKATSEKAVEFLNQIIHRFGIPNSIITDLGTQFTGTTFWDFCDDKGIVIKYVSVAHPRANGQVEREWNVHRERQSTWSMDERVASCGLGSPISD